MDNQREELANKLSSMIFKDDITWVMDSPTKFRLPYLECLQIANAILAAGYIKGQKKQIEWPEELEDYASSTSDYANGYNAAIDACKRAAEKAGINIKGVDHD